MNNDTLSIIESYGEYTLDYFLDEGILKDLPIVGPAFSAIKTGKSIQDRIFLEKIREFIDNVDENIKWREKFSDVDECYKISKKLVYIIDSTDDDEKIKLIAILFNYYVAGELDKDEFLYLSSIVSKSYYKFLKTLKSINDVRFSNDGEKYDSSVISHLYSIGLFDYSGSTKAQMKEGKVVKLGSVIYNLNEYGNILKQIIEHHD
ncbi:hypothetical protein KHM83_19485 [Fusibacter paucivorans]|uniref:Inner membrane protein n=1 Tax=Fusibacter paucivorans TaxID=76009 RepID=A0ABS5PUL2_9FIRM|nr:hypothetical protein [Fusibacter paucivorans]MBS7528854.1 hypothetical protein [Fusibacter paucivorans]